MNFDPELMQDFLTESGELLEGLDKDLVTLETAPTDLELVNGIFRALHTIKGSASFLQLTNLVTIAHAAEGALNAARNRVFTIDRAAMDLFLAAVDVVKQQFENIKAGEDLVRADANLVASLTALGEGRAVKAPAAAAAGTPAVNSTPAANAGGAVTEQPFTLPANKADLVEFLVADVEQTLDAINQQVSRLAADAERASAAAAITDLAEALGKNAEFFDVAPMARLSGLLRQVGQHGADMAATDVGRVRPHVDDVIKLLREQTKGLAAGKLIVRPIDGLCEAFESALSEEAATAGAPLDAEPAPASLPAAEPVVHTPREPADTAPASTAAVPAKTDEHRPAEHGKTGGGADQTIRVEVSRLEALLNLVGELVLQKNRVAALGRQIGANNLGTQEFREAVQQATGALDRVTGDLQLAVMKTRMQPLDKLFGKYPRLIRDLARKLNKQIALEIEGGETEVDKSVIEELGDPLIHLMRNSADHGIETPEARRRAGKPEGGTIRLSASHEGSHVQILICDDGKGIDPVFIAKKAVEKGIITQAEAAGLSDNEKMRLIFAPGFSTAEQLSDVSGRGVGMDVVRTNIEKLKGTIDIESTVGKGTTMRIKIPLTVAIMTAMMVSISGEVYAVPLSNITEIVKPDAAVVSTIRGNKVMRLRDTVLPLLEANELFNVPQEKGQPAPFAVVLSMSDKRVGLLVSGLIGQQEVVIKPLDGTVDRGGPVSGATVRDDGGVSLIVDVSRLFEIADARR